MGIEQLFSGVQAIHSNNKTFTTREGYVSEWDFNEMTELIYSENAIYNSLNPGMYKIMIAGDMYVFLLHDTITSTDKLVIKNQYHAYTVIDLKKQNIILYKAHSGKIIETHGHLLNHTVNDYLDLLVMDGITNFTTDGEVTLSHPGRLEYISMISIKVTDENGNYEDYLFNMKAYLKGLEKIHDILYLDTANNKALFCFKLGKITFTGSETIIEVPEYSDDNVSVYFYPNSLVKKNAKTICTHLPIITWEQMKDVNYIKNGMCSGTNDEDQGFYFKILRSDCENLQEFKNIMKKWNTMTTEKLDEIREAEYIEAINSTQNNGQIRRRATINTPFTITYELSKELFKHLVLDNYKIKTFFNKTWLIVTPYKHSDSSSIQALDTIIGLVPKNGIIKSIIEQMEESGNPEYYQRILDENIVIDDILNINNSTDNESNSINTIDNEHTVAVLPKDGIIKNYSIQELESGNPDKYNKILDENIIWRNLVVTGDINIRTMYFYKHLRLI